MKSGLKKITIEVGGKKIDFTPEEAKELKNILAELFGADKTEVRHVHHYDYWWNQPYTYWCGGTGVSQSATITGYDSTWTGSYNSGNVTLTAGGTSAGAITG